MTLNISSLDEYVIIYRPIIQNIK